MWILGITVPALLVLLRHGYHDLDEGFYEHLLIALASRVLADDQLEGIDKNVLDEDLPHQVFILPRYSIWLLGGISCRGGPALQHTWSSG